VQPSPSHHVTDRSVPDLDLLRALGLDPGAVIAALLDPAPNPDAAASQSLQIKTRRRESALVSFQDRNRNITRPPPPEIDKDCRPAFPYGRDFTSTSANWPRCASTFPGNSALSTS